VLCLLLVGTAEAERLVRIAIDRRQCTCAIAAKLVVKELRVLVKNRNLPTKEKVDGKTKDIIKVELLLSLCPVCTNTDQVNAAKKGGKTGPLKSPNDSLLGSTATDIAPTSTSGSSQSGGGIGTSTIGLHLADGPRPRIGDKSGDSKTQALSRPTEGATDLAKNDVIHDIKSQIGIKYFGNKTRGANTSLT